MVLRSGRGEVDGPASQERRFTRAKWYLLGLSIVLLQIFTLIGIQFSSLSVPCTFKKGDPSSYACTTIDEEDGYCASESRCYTCEYWFQDLYVYEASEEVSSACNPAFSTWKDKHPGQSPTHLLYDKQLENSLKENSFQDNVAILLVTVVTALTVATEIQDIKVCELSLRRKMREDPTPFKRRWGNALYVMLFFRQYVLIPDFIWAVVEIILHRGADAYNVCLNGVAVTFILQLDNILYASFLDYRVKAYFETHETIIPTPFERHELDFNRKLYTYMSGFRMIEMLINAQTGAKTFATAVLKVILLYAESFLLPEVFAPFAVSLYHVLIDAKYPDHITVTDNDSSPTAAAARQSETQRQDKVFQSPREGWNSLRSLTEITLRGCFRGTVTLALASFAIFSFWAIASKLFLYHIVSVGAAIWIENDHHSDRGWKVRVEAFSNRLEDKVCDHGVW
eukprot:CAMPEP_0197557504 /NCGR_PEP_ID=MMETSP1320-20131121/17242_1 /TAXON_ID=91990 /ORGANISM="Bolidomonas sp., Strain RCC2347" /LENGTH=452 /DNA_ID=CAMNT_0043118751 /DNA_START=220 /DNA_END=1575 /DNA_ORIENTATION=+